MNEVKKNDLVSVIVTTHNRCTLMKRAVESIQKQSYTYLEIIIIDDNSSFDFFSVCTRIFRSYFESFGLRYSWIGTRQTGTWLYTSK